MTTYGPPPKPEPQRELPPERPEPELPPTSPRPEFPPLTPGPERPPIGPKPEPDRKDPSSRPRANTVVMPPVAYGLLAPSCGGFCSTPFFKTERSMACD